MKGSSLPPLSCAKALLNDFRIYPPAGFPSVTGALGRSVVAEDLPSGDFQLCQSSDSPGQESIGFWFRLFDVVGVHLLQARRRWMSFFAVCGAPLTDLFTTGQILSLRGSTRLSVDINHVAWLL